MMENVMMEIIILMEIDEQNGITIVLKEFPTFYLPLTVCGMA
jgi:hypothetical protein